MLTVAPDSSVIEWQKRPTEVASLHPGAAHTGAYSLDDEVALEFGDRPDDDDHGAAQRAAGVCSSSTSRKYFTDRAMRAKAQTRTTSKRLRRVSRIRASRPGRRALAPLIPSVDSSRIWKPRCC